MLRIFSMGICAILLPSHSIRPKKARRNNNIRNTRRSIPAAQSHVFIINKDKISSRLRFAQRNPCNNLIREYVLLVSYAQNQELPNGNQGLAPLSDNQKAITGYFILVRP